GADDWRRRGDGAGGRTGESDHGDGSPLAAQGPDHGSGSLRGGHENPGGGADYLRDGRDGWPVSVYPDSRRYRRPGAHPRARAAGGLRGDQGLSPRHAAGGIRPVGRPGAAPDPDPGRGVRDHLRGETPMPEPPAGPPPRPPRVRTTAAPGARSTEAA